MNNKKILLATINAKWIHPSLALRLLKANLGSLEDNCEIMEFYLRQNLSEKLNAILSAKPFILGHSVSIWNHKAALELLEALNKCDLPNQPIIVLGGPEVSSLPETSEIFHHADYVIRGEGETAFRKLCGDLFSGEKTGKPKETVFVQAEKTKTEFQLSEVKPAYRLYTNEDLEHKLTYVESSRGCAFSCEFCMRSFYGTQVQEFPLEPFLAEMDELIRRGAQNFKFLDRSFNLNVKRSLAIMEFFLERILSSPNRICVHFEMFPGNFTPELREIIRRFPSGSLRLEIGIQTLNPQTAALIRRSGNAETALEILSFLARETNAIVHADLIAGLPGEDLASFGKGFDRLWTSLNPKNNAMHKTATSAETSMKRIEIQLGILKLLPGAPIAKHSLEYGIVYDANPPYEVMESAAIPFTEMNRIKNFARFWELIVNRGNFTSFVESFLSGGKPEAEQPIFDKFMALSDELLKCFGRNWGIDRKELLSSLGSLKQFIYVDEPAV